LQFSSAFARDFFLSMFLYSASSASFAASTGAGSNEWMQVDHQGVVSARPGPESKVPSWTGWSERAEPSRGGDILYRSKTEPDGTKLRFDYNSLWGPPCDDRFQVSVPLSDGWRKTGFADRAGRVVIQPKYICVEHFINGLVAVRESRETPWQLLDKNGNVKYTLPKDMKPSTSARFWGVSKDGVLPVERGDIDA
jgi:hypothetical protein